ncbi:MAG: hypothetical protein ACRCUJ_11070 [Phocaeicola sp.]
MGSTADWSGQHCRLEWAALPTGVGSTADWSGQHCRLEWTVKPT